jgi:hypothetical protein
MLYQESLKPNIIFFGKTLCSFDPCTHNILVSCLSGSQNALPAFKFLPCQFALKVCPVSLPCQITLPVCPDSLPCQFALPVLAFSLASQLALSDCPVGFSCQLALSAYPVSVPFCLLFSEHI